MLKTRSAFAAATVACLSIAAPLVAGVGTAQAVPAAASSATTYTAAQSVSYPYRAPGVSATITFTRLADTAYQVSVSGTTTTARPTTMPAGFSSGLMVPVGAYRMSSNNGTMTLGSNAVTFGFDKAYLNGYQAPFTFSGSWTAVVTSASTGTQTITVGGHPYTIAIHAPAANGRANGAGQRIMVTRSFEVDNATLKTAKVAGIYFAADNDRKLGYGELAQLYTKSAYRRSFAEQFVFVTVRVPKTATQNELLGAINARLPRGWAKLSTTALQAPGVKAPVNVVTAWEVNLSQGARPAPKGAAWGPKHNIAETYVASSEQRHV